MTLSEFITKYTGKLIASPQNTYLGECVSLAKVWEVSQGWPEIYGNAKDEEFSFDPDFYEWHSSGQPSQGDLMIFGTGVGQYGHISIFVSGQDDSSDNNTFTSFDQNWPKGSSCRLTKHTYQFINGWISPKGETMAGFDDNQMNSNFISLSTQLRTSLLGHVDTAGVDAERAAGLASLKAGGVDSFAKIAMGIVNSQEFKDRWMLKTDCKPTECSPDLSEEFNQEVMKNTELQKELDLCNKKECICPEPKPCPAIDDLSASDLIIRGIRKWLGIK